MGGLAPGKLKSRRGWPSSPRRLIHGCYFFDPGFKNSLREKLYQLCGNGDTSSPSTRGGLAYSGPPKWPCLSPPPARWGACNIHHANLSVIVSITERSTGDPRCFNLQRNTLFTKIDFLTSPIVVRPPATCINLRSFADRGINLQDLLKPANILSLSPANLLGSITLKVNTCRVLL